MNRARTTTAPGERGVALVLVVSILAVISVMVAHMVVVSRVSRVEAKVLADRHSLRHTAESAAEWAYWMYVNDRRQFPGAHRDLLVEQPPVETRGNQPPWLADGRKHTLTPPPMPGEPFRVQSGDHEAPGTDIHVSVRIEDVNRGYSLQGKSPHNNIDDSFLNLEENEELRAFLDRLADYTDQDNLTRLDGFEQAQYESLGEPALPRDAPIEFREEVLWIPGVVEAFQRGTDGSGRAQAVLDLFQPVPPPGRTMPNSKKPSIFAASPALIRQKLDLGLGQAEAVLQALERAESENLPLATMLSPDILQQIRRHFSAGESGVAKFIATARSPGGTSREVRILRDCRGTVGQTQRTFKYIDSWETVVR